MPADRKDLAARVAAASSDDTSRGINYRSAFALIGELAGEEAARRCDPLRRGTRTDLLSYPIGDYLTLAWNLADLLEEKLGGVDGAFFRLGARTFTSHLESVVARTFFAIAGRDIRRALCNVHWAYRATVSYGERRVEWLGERRCRLTFRRDFLVPAFHRGVLQTGIEAMGGKEVRVDGRETGFLEAVYDIAWE